MPSIGLEVTALFCSSHGFGSTGRWSAVPAMTEVCRIAGTGADGSPGSRPAIGGGSWVEQAAKSSAAAAETSGFMENPGI